MTTTDRVTMREAATMLGVSHVKMWQLVRDHVLTVERNPLIVGKNWSGWWTLNDWEEVPQK